MHQRNHHEDLEHREMERHILAKARDKGGLASEHFHQAVAQKAYELWEKRGHAPGGSNTDWLKAEETVKILWRADQSFPSMV